LSAPRCPRSDLRPSEGPNTPPGSLCERPLAGIGQPALELGLCSDGTEATDAGPHPKPIEPPVTEQDPASHEPAAGRALARGVRVEAEVTHALTRAERPEGDGCTAAHVNDRAAVGNLLM
jgi:hypothetical protein